jgi:hypothetical protein
MRRRSVAHFSEISVPPCRAEITRSRVEATDERTQSPFGTFDIGRRAPMRSGAPAASLGSSSASSLAAACRRGTTLAVENQSVLQSAPVADYGRAAVVPEPAR